MIKVLGIKIIDRIKEAGLTQNILSKNAHIIATRLGFHEVTNELCSREACIIIHLSGDPSGYSDLESQLKQIGGIKVGEMIFEKDFSPENNTNAPSILGVLVERNPETVLEVQKILSSYGCYIRTRLGVNEIFQGKPAGLIILELKGDAQQRSLLEKDLRSLDNVHVRALRL